MTPRRRRTPPNKTDWIKIAGLAFTVLFAILNLVWAWFLFNSALSADVAVLKQQVGDLRENQRDLVNLLRERERRDHGE